MTRRVKLTMTNQVLGSDESQLENGRKRDVEFIYHEGRCKPHCKNLVSWSIDKLDDHAYMDDLEHVVPLAAIDSQFNAYFIVSPNEKFHG
jgi:hypothetical protein